MASIPDTDVVPGQVLAGKFRIERVLGRGGMGVVVAATHIHLEEQVALKFLLPAALENPEAVRRFEREARAAVKIKSEHVARVTDVGTLESGAPYMVMEYLHGMDLGDYLDQTGPLPFDETADLLLQACEALAEAHSLGIVHRDLKPANLFRILRSDGSPSIKVLDFGISKVTSGNEASMTRTSSMMGSPYYMSPEQMTSAKNVDSRTDIWALGIILHELLTGKVPYQGETIPEICAQVLQSDPPRLRSLRPDAPLELEHIIEKALAKKREDRFEDMAAFAAAIAQFGSEYSSRSVERISKVLGVAPTARTSSLSGVGAPSGNDIAGAPSASTTSSEDHATNAAATGRSGSTLGGAAHTQLDYSLPKHKSRAPFLIGAAVILVGVGALATFGRGSGSEQGDQQPAAALNPEEARPTQPDARALEDAKALEEPTTTEPTTKPEGPPPPEEVAQPSSAAPAPVPAPQVAPAPRPAPRPITRPKSTAKPTTAPKPASVAPAPAPQPTPRSSSNLYLDRK